MIDRGTLMVYLGHLMIFTTLQLAKETGRLQVDSEETYKLYDWQT